MKRWPLAAPYLVGSFLLVLTPLALAAALAFTDYFGFRAAEFTGADNLARVAGDRTFWHAVGVSALVVVVVQNAFVPALLVTGGGPANATLTAPLLIYRRAFEYGELGYASTLSVTLLVLTGVAAALPLWLAARLAARQRT